MKNDPLKLQFITKIFNKKNRNKQQDLDGI